MSGMSSEELMVQYLIAREKERDNQSSQILNTLTEREQQLVREAAVMGHVLGAQAAGGIPSEDYPADSIVLREVILACQKMPDLYPVIGNLSE